MVVEGVEGIGSENPEKKKKKTRKNGSWWLEAYTEPASYTELPTCIMFLPLSQPYKGFLES